MPLSPSAVASSARPSVSIVNSRSEYAASSRGVSAQPRPASSSGCALAGVRFHTVTWWPASAIRRAIPEPIAPSPAKPIRSI